MVLLTIKSVAIGICRLREIAVGVVHIAMVL